MSLNVFELQTNFNGIDGRIPISINTFTSIYTFTYNPSVELVRILKNWDQDKKMGCLGWVFSSEKRIQKNDNQQNVFQQALAGYDYK
jgi:hypothetical protein